MEEFIRLYLTGKRAENMARFRRMRTILGLIGAFFTLIPVFLTIAADNLPLTVAFSALGVLFGVAEAGLNYYEAAYLRALVELQSEADALELRGAERARSEKLHAAWAETLGKRSVLWKIAPLLTGLSYLLLAASAVVCAALSLPPIILLAACILFGILAGVSSGMQTVADGRARASLYERAEREIGELKREKLGLSEKRIFAEAENARGFSQLPVSVAAFLKEDVEKEDFRAVSKKSGILSFAIGFGLALAILLPIPLGSVWEKLGSTVSWLLGGSILTVAFGIMLALLLPLEARKREIYRRNYEKLGEGEADALRRELQTAWVRLQRRANRMFLAILVGSVALGVLVGLIGYFTVEGVILADAIGSSIMLFFFPAAILSVIVWIVMFAVYRRSVRQREARLKSLKEEGQ